MDNNLLDILIPTLNREQALIRNLENIQKIILNNGLKNDINIIISDNGSELTSFEAIKNYLGKDFRVEYRLFRQEKNIGIENNVLFLIDQSNAKYVMTLGDDDYFTENYLIIVINYLRIGNCTGIISNSYPIDINGKRIGSNDDKVTEDIIYNKQDLWICGRGNQLSCLTFMRRGVVESYKKNVRNNVYPFVYFMAMNIERGNIIYISREPYAVTVIPKKNWDYSFDKLMGEYAIVLDCLPYQDKNDARRQLKIIIDKNAWRFCHKATYFHPIKFLRRVINYQVSDQIKVIIIGTFIKYLFTIPFRRFKYRFQNTVVE